MAVRRAQTLVFIKLNHLIGTRSRTNENSDSTMQYVFSYVCGVNDFTGALLDRLKYFAFKWEISNS